jgi:hypothetical protein
MRMKRAGVGLIAALAVGSPANPGKAADLKAGYQPAPIVGGPVAAPLTVAPIMVSPIRTRSFKPIQTHVIAQPAPNPRAIGEGPVFGPAYPVIIVVKP